MSTPSTTSTLPGIFPSLAEIAVMSLLDAHIEFQRERETGEAVEPPPCTESVLRCCQRLLRELQEGNLALYSDPKKPIQALLELRKKIVRHDQNLHKALDNPNAVANYSMFQALSAVEKKEKDDCLIEFFYETFQRSGLFLQGSRAERANSIRAWMGENQEVLEMIYELELGSHRGELIFSSVPDHGLPQEVSLLTGLEVLQISGITENFHLPNLTLPHLTQLSLKGRLSALPRTFKLPRLTNFVLTDAKIAIDLTTLQLPMLQSLNLQNNPIEVLPKKLPNLPQLQFLNLSYTPIANKFLAIPMERIPAELRQCLERMRYMLDFILEGPEILHFCQFMGEDAPAPSSAAAALEEKDQDEE